MKITIKIEAGEKTWTNEYIVPIDVNYPTQNTDMNEEINEIVDKIR